MVNITSQDRTLIVKITGDIDHHTADEIREKVDMAYSRNHAVHMVFDFQDVAFMDSSGIGLLIGRYKNAQKLGGRLMVAGAGQNVGRIFQLAGLPKIIETSETLDGALTALSNRR